MATKITIITNVWLIKQSMSLQEVSISLGPYSCVEKMKCHYFGSAATSDKPRESVHSSFIFNFVAPTQETFFIAIFK